jgi:hypothetical protein
MNLYNNTSSLNELKELTKKLNDRDMIIKNSLSKIKEIIDNSNYTNSECVNKIKQIIDGLK